MNFDKQTQKYNKVGFGLIVGLILPIIGFIASYYIKVRIPNYTITDYFMSLLMDSPDKMDIIISSMLPNMLLFYFVNFRWGMYEFTKGIVGITLLMGILVVISSL
jgi:hypothetical protein